MYRLVLDTETTDLNKCFAYDVGWVIIEEDGTVAAARHFVIEQVWHNLPLFESAYYKEKRPRYVQLMRQHKAIMAKWGHAMRQLTRDIKTYNITDAYAYNSSFDDKVITYNSDWYKTINPLDNIALHDIWGYASVFITKLDSYRAFCEEHERLTDTGNYKGSAEVVYQYLKNQPDFVEEHMGLYDSLIEAEILTKCITEYGAEWDKNYPVTKVLARPQEHPFTLKINNEVIYTGAYWKKYTRNDTYNFSTM